MSDQIDLDQPTALTADIVSAYVSNNPVPVAELPNLIGDIHRSLTRLMNGVVEAPTEPPKPAVPVKKSLHDDYIICLEDGKKFKSLKRHISVHYGLTPNEYRQKWNLPGDYPMVAPSYSAARSAMAKKFKLGRKPQEKPVPVAVKRRRKTAAS